MFGFASFAHFPLHVFCGWAVTIPALSIASQKQTATKLPSDSCNTCATCGVAFKPIEYHLWKSHENNTFSMTMVYRIMARTHPPHSILISYFFDTSSMASTTLMKDSLALAIISPANIVGIWYDGISTVLSQFHRIA